MSSGQIYLYTKFAREMNLRRPQDESSVAYLLAPVETMVFTILVSCDGVTTGYRNMTNIMKKLTNTHTRTPTHPHTRTHPRACTHMRTYTLKHARANTNKSTRTNARTHTSFEILMIGFREKYIIRTRSPKSTNRFDLGIWMNIYTTYLSSNLPIA